MKTYILIFSALFFSASLSAQFTLENDQPLEWYIENVLLGGGVVVENATFNFVSDSIVNEQFGSFDAGCVSSFPLSNGIILSTGDISVCQGPNDSSGQSVAVTNGIFGEPDLESLLMGFNVNDVAILEFDFIPANNLMLFDFVFASEEYLEFVNSSFNDVFGFFVSGQGITGTFSNNSMNVALIPGTIDYVSIDNVNDQVNSSYYIDNNSAPAGDSTYTQFDGYTTSIPVSFSVVPNTVYHIKMTVADASDSAWDSAVFIKENSFKSIAQPLGIQGIENIDLSLSPMPVQNILDINIEDATIVLKAIYLYDLTGKQVITGSANDLMDHSLDLSKLKNGIYLAELRTNFGILTKRIIKE